MRQAVGAVAGRVASVTVSVRVEPPRCTFNVALSPGWSAPTAEVSSFALEIGLPFTETMTSPDLTPAAAAGPPARTVPTTAPVPFAFVPIETPR